MKHIFSLIAILFLSSLTWGQCVLTYSVDSIPASCAGSCDGAIVVTFNNTGTPAAPYVVAFQNSLGVVIGSNTFFAESGTYTFEGVCAGDVTVSFQSYPSPPCFFQETISVTEPAPMVITSVDVIHENIGLFDGEITVNVTGGIIPYNYSINNGGTFQPADQFTGLETGIYFVMVQDDSSCSVSQVVSVGEIISTGCEVIATVAPQPVFCSGTCDGEILYEYENLQMTLGAPYTVTLEDSDGTIIDVQVHAAETQSILFENLCADTYTIILQGSSCTFTISTTVLSPLPMTLWVNSTNPSFGEDDGTAELFAIGGVPGYLYSVDGGGVFQLSPNFSDLPEGTHQAVVQDANGCQQSFDFTLEDNTSCALGITATPASTPSCYSSCDGSLDFVYTDANAHMSYSISLIQYGVTVQTATANSANGSGIFTGVCAGDYTVQITDGLGCVLSDAVTITQPTPLILTSVSTTNTDNGVSTGTATINATGGQTPYTYSLDGTNYFSSNLFSGLSAGVHTAYVQDDNGCAYELMFVINKNSSCDFNIITATNMLSCAGSCDGYIALAFNGTASDAPFSVLLEKDGNIVQTAVGTSSNFVDTLTGLCPGTYLLTIGNSTGCEQLAVAVIQEPSIITVNATTQIASTGNNDGAILVIASGGTAPYEYSIDNQTNWQSSPNFNALGTGSYTTWVKDSNGCLGIYTVEVEDTSSCAFIINITTTSTSCELNCDGILSCTFLDVVTNPPYVIYLSQGVTPLDTSATFTSGFSGLHQFHDLCAGAYKVKVVDAYGCTDEQNVYIHAPAYLGISGLNVVDATAGNSDGSAEILAIGGTAPYEFWLDESATWQNENVFNDLTSGFYVMMVKDANDCFFIHSFTINEQPGCNITTTFFELTPMSCYDSCNAVIQYGYFEAVNTPPYTVELILNTAIMETNTYSTNNFTGTWDSLCLGIYNIVVTNGNGCKSYVPTLTLVRPPDLLLTGTITNATTGMTNGSVELNATGGLGGHEYSIDDILYQGSAFFGDFAPGVYTAYVVDANGCSDFLDFEIFENPSCDIDLLTSSTPVYSCHSDCNGSISFDYDDANNNPPYAVTLMNSAGAIVGSDIGVGSSGNGLFIDLCAGDYAVVVTDASGCQSAANVTTIAQPSYLDVDVDIVHPTDGYYNGSILLTPLGGTGPYEYSTNNQATWTTNNSLLNVAAGFYIIYVRDANGCIVVVCVVLIDGGGVTINELSANISIYPNPTQGMVFVSAQNIQSVIVYDISGKHIELPEIVASNGTALDFSGVASGMYILEITSLDGEVLRTQVVKN